MSTTPLRPPVGKAAGETAIPATAPAWRNPWKAKDAAVPLVCVLPEVGEVYFKTKSCLSTDSTPTRDAIIASMHSFRVYLRICILPARYELVEYIL